jgi:hypothetical protein
LVKVAVVANKNPNVGIAVHEASRPVSAGDTELPMGEIPVPRDLDDTAMEGGMKRVLTENLVCLAGLLLDFSG